MAGLCIGTVRIGPVNLKADCNRSNIGGRCSLIGGTDGDGFVIAVDLDGLGGAESDKHDKRWNYRQLQKAHRMALLNSSARLAQTFPVRLARREEVSYSIANTAYTVASRVTWWGSIDSGGGGASALALMAIIGIGLGICGADIVL